MSKEQARYLRLANITKLINTKLELREVLEHVVTAISEEIVQCDAVGIYLPQGDGTFRGYIGKPEVINGMTLDMDVVDPDVDMLAKEVIETRKSIYIPDTGRDDRPNPRNIEVFQIKSLLALPIYYEDDIYGLVYLFDYGIPMDLSESEIQSVEAYVNMAAVAIRNANDITRKEALLAEKQMLLDVTRDLSMCSTVQEVLDICFDYVGRVLENTNIGVHLLDPVAEVKLKPAKLSKDSDWSEEEWMKTHRKVKLDYRKDRLFQEVIRTKKAVMVPDVFVDPRPNHYACSKFGIKGIFMMPLVSAGEILGTIPVVNLEKRGHTYTKAEMQLAQSIVDATASALSNLLYMEKQEQIIEERTIELTEKNKELENVVSELKRLSREKELILDSAGDGIFGLNLEGEITFCNPAGVTMLGYEQKEQLIGQSYSRIFHRIPSHVKENPDTFFAYNKDNRLNDGTERDEYFFRKDGSRFPVEYVISSIQEEGNIVGYVVTFKDITQRKQMEEKVKYHAYYDSLTNLPNRVLLRDRLKQALTYAQLHNEKLAVMFLDLDRFKMINDTLGHSVGDQLLEQVADRLKKAMPKGATVSRQGGDEFTIILPNIQRNEDAIQVAEHVLDSFERSFQLRKNEVFVKTSIGISLFPKDGDDAETLIKNADTAMYRAKELAGNNVQFYRSEMDHRTLESVKLENDLYRALEREEFKIYYQPQYDYRRHKMIGVEALLRWHHPKKEIISPYEFIPIAEETGLIVPIGEWVLRQACEQLKIWHESGHSITKVAVNLSARQFEQRNLVEMVKKILLETEIKPEFLEMELTENSIIKNTEMTVKTMRELKALGLQISIDDFGTGYSSLGYLKNFPIDTLKIDKSFVRDVIKDADHSAITDTIIHLGQNLKLNVIAEGVETKEQALLLSSKGCYLMQGYYFSPPISAEEMSKSLVREDSILT